jgi:hypothetical protein
MITRNTHRLAAALAAAALLLAAALPAGAAHAIRSPGTGTVTIQSVHASSNWRGGYGYGRGWCYWHPYVCYRSR